MRILYGVVGEGMGHATRSCVILRHLVKSHDVQIVVSGRAHAFLRKTFPQLEVHEIAGLNMVYEDNEVQRRRTALDFLKKLPAFAENFETMTRLSQSFRPELVISDFESFAYLYAKKHDLPVLSIDNMQIINRCELDVEIPPEEQASLQMAKTIVKAKLPHCDHYLVTTFFFPPVRKPRTSLFPPILRDAVLDAPRSDGEHVLVYQTSDTFHDLVPTLQRLPGRFFVYGLKRDQEVGNVTLKGFSEDGFVRDLASARAVLAGGGFSLMGEAVYLGKPMLSVPLKGQFEQTLNALYLQKLGYGEYHRELSEAAIAAFLARAPEYARNVAAHKQERNTAILGKLDALIAEIAANGRLVSRGAEPREDEIED
ncbi:MAG TPA: MJ1255/VC2487 family glycosyltransferase [Polyangia bacterium]|nr:MJ1255/VC2487 family glycosyltransferase [Polyangia bacterium]